MADCEQLAGELQVLEQLLKKYSTEHERKRILKRIEVLKAEQQKLGCLSERERETRSNE